MISIICLILSAALMIEISTRNALLRGHSFTMAVAFAMLLCPMLFLTGSNGYGIATLCATISVYALTKTCQDTGAAGWAYYASLALGCGAMADPRMTLFIPMTWILMRVSLHSLSVKTAVASVLGTLTPLWFATAYCIYTRQWTAIEQHLLWNAGKTDIGPEEVLAMIALTATGTACAWHYTRTRNEDKLRPRMIYSFFTNAMMFAVVLMLIQPYWLDFTSHFVALSTTPLLARVINNAGNRTR